MASEEEYDYSALEAEARAVMSREKYGLLGYILSPKHGLAIDGSNRLGVTGEFSFDIGYLCGHAAIWLNDKLLELDREPKLCRGKDSRSMFNSHYFAQDKNQNILDAVPWFDFEGEGHKPKQFPTREIVDQSLTVHFLSSRSLNFLRLQKADENLYMLYFDFPCYLAHELKSNKINFEFSIVEVDTCQCATFDVTANLFRYRLTFPEDYTGYTVEENAEENLAYLIDQGAIEEHTFGPYDSGKPIEQEKLERLEEILKGYLPAELALIHKLAYMPLE